MTQNLFGEPAQKKPTAEKKAKKVAEPKSDGSVKRAIDAFHEAFQAKWKFPHGGGYGFAGRKFKELIAAWGEEEVQRMIRVFFETTDPKVSASDYSPAAFFFNVQRLRINGTRPRGARDERTIHNVDAIARATGRRS